MSKSSLSIILNKLNIFAGRMRAGARIRVDGFVKVVGSSSYLKFKIIFKRRLNLKRTEDYGDFILCEDAFIGGVYLFIHDFQVIWQWLGQASTCVAVQTQMQIRRRNADPKLG